MPNRERERGSERERERLNLLDFLSDLAEAM